MLSTARSMSSGNAHLLPAGNYGSCRSAAVSGATGGSGGASRLACRTWRWAGGRRGQAAGALCRALRAAGQATSPLRPRRAFRVVLLRLQPSLRADSGISLRVWHLLQVGPCREFSRGRVETIDGSARKSAGMDGSAAPGRAAVAYAHMESSVTAHRHRATMTWWSSVNRQVMGGHHRKPTMLWSSVGLA